MNADNAAVYDTVIFAGPPPMKQRLWPRHCVQDTWGSELHKDLKVNLLILFLKIVLSLLTNPWLPANQTLCMQIVDGGTKVYKGTNPEVDSYSVFWDNKKLSDTSLCSLLKQKGISDVYVCGLAYDVCVGEFAWHKQHASFGQYWNNQADVFSSSLLMFIRSYRIRLAVSGIPNSLDWRLLPWCRRNRHRGNQRRHFEQQRSYCSV